MPTTAATAVTLSQRGAGWRSAGVRSAYATSTRSRSARALAAASPLTTEFPENPLFLLIAGDIAAKLGHNDEAAMRFRAAAAAPIEDGTCAERVREIAREALAALEPPSK